MKFSIIIPIYNVAPYLRECLDSVLAQAFADWEAICVDDGSTDGSGAILDEYMAKDARFRVVHQKNAGVSAARNGALDVVRGEWVCFVDGDDVLGKSWLADAVVSIDANSGVDWVRTGYTNWFIEESPESHEFRSFGTGVYDGECLVEYAWQEIAQRSMIWMNFYRAERIVGVRFPVGVVMREDAIFELLLLGNIRRMATIDSTAYYYRRFKLSASRRPQEHDAAVTFQRALNEVWLRNRGGSSECFTKLSAKNFHYWRERCPTRTSSDIRSFWKVLCCACKMGAFNHGFLTPCERLRWRVFSLTGWAGVFLLNRRILWQTRFANLIK